MTKFQKEMYKKSGLKPRRGEKTYDYCSMTFRYWCPECRSEVKADGKCYNCGTWTTSFNDVGML